MRLTRDSLSVLLLLCAVVPGVVLGQERPKPEHPDRSMMREMQERMGHMRGHHAPMARVAAYAPPHLLERRELLKLTAEQVSRLEELAQELKQAHEKAEEQTKAHREQVMEVWQAERPDVNQLSSHAEAVMQAEHNAHLAMLTAAARAKGLLTPEQRGRVEGWLDVRQTMMHGRMERREGRRIHRQ